MEKKNKIKYSLSSSKFRPDIKRKLITIDEITSEKIRCFVPKGILFFGAIDEMAGWSVYNIGLVRLTSWWVQVRLGVVGLD